MRHVPFVATDHEVSHGRYITWTLSAEPAPEHIREAWIGTRWVVEITANGSRDGKPFRANHLFPTSLRTTPEALLLRLVRDRWSIEGWHCIRDTQLHEDAHLNRGNSDGAMATLRTAAMNLMQLARFQSIRADMQAVMHDTTALLRWRSVSHNQTNAETLKQPWVDGRGGRIDLLCASTFQGGFLIPSCRIAIAQRPPTGFCPVRSGLA